jgi:diaminopimelate epimerase
MQIPFTKAHGAGNDFLLTWAAAAPDRDLSGTARMLCDRHTGVGADGWLLVWPAEPPDHDGRIHLYNSDGSEAEISGNGTRCAAAFLIREEPSRNEVRILTGAGLKHLRLLRRDGIHFEFEMNMGAPEVTAAHFDLPLTSGTREVTLLWVGNPQCAVPVEDFDFDWRGMGAEIEEHPHFPNRTNVSFVRRLDRHTIDVRFYERGAGETMSSGTGSTAAAAMAIARGWVESPVQVSTPAGPLAIRVEDDYFLTGPVEITADGWFYR